MRRQARRRQACMAGLAGVLVLTGFLITARHSGAAGLQHTREYAVCMRLARVSPTEGFETALAWTDAGGGGAAKHCAAVALFTMGQYGEAAKRFEALAQSLAGNAAVKADLLAQAGQSWHQAGEIDRAFAVQSAALELDPRSPEVRIDRAMVLAERGQYGKALEDLNVSLEVDENLVEALVLRASAYRYLDRLPLALQDVTRALELSRDYPEALLERGIIYRLQGHDEAARADWLALIRLYEGIPAADAAQRNIEKLDVTQKD